MCFTDLCRISLDVCADDYRPPSQALCFARDGIECGFRRGCNDNRVFRSVLSFRLAHGRRHRWQVGVTVSLQDFDGRVHVSRSCDRRPRRNIGGIVAGHVRNHVCEQIGPGSPAGKPPSLDDGQLLSDTVDFLDTRAAVQKEFRNRLLPRNRDAVDRCTEQRGTAAGHHEYHAIVGRSRCRNIQHSCGRIDRLPVGHRMPRFDDLDVPG